ncbi:MAG: CvpA family protein [Clostridium sp.]|nr:CvpA family protein [Clostridium sp.]
MLDIIIIALLIIFAVVGSKRGVIHTIFAFLSTLLALFLSFIVYPVINTILKLIPMYTMINEKVNQRVSKINFGHSLQGQDQIISEGVNWLPDFVSEVLIQNNNEAVYQTLGVQNVVDYISISITNIIVGLIAILITWVILKCVLAGAICKFGKAIASLPIISSLDHLGGFALGIIKGLVTLWIIALIIPFIMTSSGNLESYIQGTVLCKWLYENNLVLLAFEQIFNV